jgi:DNA-binding response OmpR family regulator
MRLLIVEDDGVAAEVLAKGLREQAYAVDVAADGRAALDRALMYESDLIVLDVMLPEIDGLEVCRRIRKRGRAVPIIMLTARTGIEERVEGLDAGADDYLPKPFHFSELVARIRALLRRGPVLGPSVQRVADLSIDTRTRRVERNGLPIELTTKEYTLLAYLARRRDQVVTRTDISEHVWDERFDPMSNVITKRLIHTRRGAGYVLSAKGDETRE